jgi:MFS family permease
VLVNRINAKLLMIVGVGLSTVGLVLATQLSTGSTYPQILASLVLFGAGNGISFVTLTQASLSGVAPEDAGAASGLVNVAQQLGGTLGVAVLVTVFGSASKHAASHPVAGLAPVAQAHHAFVYAADRSFVAAAAFLIAGILLIAAFVRTPSSSRPAATAAPMAEPAAA